MLIAIGFGGCLLAGCGESEDTLTTDEYRAQADEICVREAGITTLDGKEIRRPLVATASANRDLADDKQAALDQLDELDPPTTDGAIIDEWLAAREEQIDLLREGVDAQKAGDTPRVKALTNQFTNARRREFATAGDFGMKVCSHPPGGAKLN